MNNPGAHEKFKDGLEELLYVNPIFGAIARSMGAPVWDFERHTAYVTYDTNSDSIVFAFNPDFIQTLSMEEVAGVIAHETHHVVLDHLKEMTAGQFNDSDALIKAQECIINDTIDTIFQLPLPEGVMRGPALVGVNCAPLSTIEAYKLFQAKDQEQDPNETNFGDTTSPNNGGGARREPDEADGGAAEAPESSGDALKPAVAGSDGGCDGIVIPEGYEFAAAEAMDSVLGKAAASEGIPKDDFIDQLNNTVNPYFSPFSNVMTISEATIGRERMNWRLLLSRINPKVLEAGSPRRRTRNNWTKSNRRMAAIYPRVILPVNERVEPKKTDAGNQLPVFVVALDLSGSIPRALVKTLQGLLDEIPDELIRAYPCTWSDRSVPFVNGKVCSTGGTNINSVVNYVKEVQATEKVDPYVLVITDGEYRKPASLPGKEWFYMGVDRRAVRTIKSTNRHYGGLVGPNEEVYCVDDFKL